MTHRLRLALRVLTDRRLTAYQLAAVNNVVEDQGLLYGLRVDQTERGVRLRAHNPQMLAVNSCNVVAPTRLVGHKGDTGSELLLIRGEEGPDE